MNIKIKHFSAVLFSLIFFYSCQEKNINDTRIMSQRRFIDVINNAESKISESKNEIVRDENLDAQIEAVSKFAKDSLKGEFENWDAVIESINNEPHGLTGVSIDIYMNKNINDTSQYPVYSSVVFSSYINKEDKEIINTLKNMSVGEKIKISGRFDFKDNLLEMSSYGSGLSGNVFENPKIYVVITECISHNKSE